MKKLVLILSIGLISCSPYPSKQTYRIAVTYSNGTIDTLTLTGKGRNVFSINRGNLIVTGVGSRIVRSNVQEFDIISFGESRSNCSDKYFENISKMQNKY